MDVIMYSKIKERFGDGVQRGGFVYVFIFAFVLCIHIRLCLSLFLPFLPFFFSCLVPFPPPVSCRVPSCLILPLCI